MRTPEDPGDKLVKPVRIVTIFIENSVGISQIFAQDQLVTILQN